MSYHPGKFAWFEHVSTDTAKAKQFHEQLFGWQVKSFAPGGYEVIHNGESFIGGVVAAEPGMPNYWRGWMSVDDVDDRYRAAVAAGARAVMPPTDFPGVGRGATLVDPTGALVSIWKGLEGDRPDEDETAVGDWCWNELATPDPKKALEFYESVFGYTHDDMDVGPEGPYHILKGADGVARGGVMKTSSDAMPAMWVPYVRVEDADAIAARVAPLGGRLMLAPTNIENVGRIGMLYDPLGAPLGFIKTVVKA